MCMFTGQKVSNKEYAPHLGSVLWAGFIGTEHKGFSASAASIFKNLSIVSLILNHWINTITQFSWFLILPNMSGAWKGEESHTKAIASENKNLIWEKSVEQFDI